MLGTVNDADFEERFHQWNARTLNVVEEIDANWIKKDPTKEIAKVERYKKPKQQVKGILTQKLENNLSFLNINPNRQGTDEINAVRAVSNAEIQNLGKGSPAKSGDETEPKFVFPATHNLLRPILTGPQTLKDKWKSNLAFLEMNMNEEDRLVQRNLNLSVKNKPGPGTLQSKLEKNLKYLNISNSKTTVEGNKKDSGHTTETKLSGSRNMKKHPGKSADEPEDINSGNHFSIKLDCPKVKRYANKINKNNQIHVPIDMIDDGKYPMHFKEIETQKLYRPSFEVGNNAFQKQPAPAEGNAVINTAVIPNLNKPAISLPDNQEMRDDIVKKKNQLKVGNEDTVGNIGDIGPLNGSEKQLPDIQDTVANHTNLKLKAPEINMDLKQKASDSCNGEVTRANSELDTYDSHGINYVTGAIDQIKPEEMLVDNNIGELNQLKTNRNPSFSARIKQNRILRPVKLLKKTEKLSDYIGDTSPVKRRRGSIEKHKKRKRSKCKSDKRARKSSSTEGLRKDSKPQKRKRKQKKVASKKSRPKDDITNVIRVPSAEKIINKNKNSVTEKEPTNAKDEQAMWIEHDALVMARQKLAESLEAKSDCDSETVLQSEHTQNRVFDMKNNDTNETSQHDTTKPIDGDNASHTETNIKHHAGSEISEHCQPWILVPLVFIQQQDNMRKLENSLLNKVDSGQRLTGVERAVLEASETVNDYLGERQELHHHLYTLQSNIEQLEEENLWVMVHALLGKLGATDATYSRLLTISQNSSAEARVILQVFLDLLFYELIDSPSNSSMNIIKTVGELAQQLSHRAEFQ